MDEAVLVYTTWPDAETARAASLAAVEARLAACANLQAPITSIYCWEGEVEEAVETPVLFKTTAAAVERLRDLLIERHPYRTPCVVVLPVVAAGSNPAFLAWIAAQTDGK